MSRYTKYHGDRATQIDYLRGKGWQFLTLKGADALLGWHEFMRDGKPVFEAKAWTGKCDKPAWYYLFSTLAKLESWVKEWQTKRAGSLAYREAQRKAEAERRANLKASDYWQVGDVLSNSWGYEQTNVDWYQVVEVKARSIVIRSIKRNYGGGEGCAPMSGYSQPRRGEFCGEPILKHLDDRGGVSFEFGCGSKWDGKPQYESHYA